jgi:hypothetical protein
MIGQQKCLINKATLVIVIANSLLSNVIGYYLMKFEIEGKLILLDNEHSLFALNGKI